MFESDITIPEPLRDQACDANRRLYDPSMEMTGWLDPTIFKTGIDRIKTEARRLQSLADVVVCVGIGGSYLGTRAIYEALGGGNEDLFNPEGVVSGPQGGGLGPEKEDEKSSDFVEFNRKILFAGHNLSETYMRQLLRTLRDKNFALIVISKSGTTLEPAIAFRILRTELERRHGREGAAERTVAITDACRGALKTLADREGYTTFTIPDDVGGRFSVLTPVGLLPLAVADVDIDALMEGAVAMERRTAASTGFDKNPAAQYAAIRNLLYGQGKKIEILTSYEPSLHYLCEWWKQLFGESEGKQHMGIFPASTTFTTDLHSLGQWIQEGERTIFETALCVESTPSFAAPCSSSGRGTSCTSPLLIATPQQNLTHFEHKDALFDHKGTLKDVSESCSQSKLSEDILCSNCGRFGSNAATSQGDVHDVPPLDAKQDGVEAIVISAQNEDIDGLNYLAGKSLSEINRIAERGVTMAHKEGGVPVLCIEIPRLDARSLGELIYFFEKSCAISALLLGVNPFDQPGVEAYKKHLTTLLRQ